MTVQIALRLPDALAAELDEVVAADPSLATRTDALRTAIQEFIRRRRAALVDAAIVAGYRRIPPGEPDEWGSIEASHALAAGLLGACLDAEDGGW